MTEMPTWEHFMRPSLEVLGDGVTRGRRALGVDIAHHLNLTPEQLQATVSSGQPLFQNRIGWGLSFLTNIGALTRPSRGNYAITDAGRELLAQFSGQLTELELRALGDDPESPIRTYVATTSGRADKSPQTVEQSLLTPSEQVQNGIARIHDEISTELLARLQEKESDFFEQAVVELLLAMNYGGAMGRGSVTSITNDGGIDGVIDQDVLGLSRVYVQAKRYATGNPVQRPEVQAFVGALSGKADNGVFITTSRFTEGAVAYAEGVPTRIILIDGKQLTDLMIRYEVGVQVSETYKIVEVDEDFFS